MEIRRRMFRLLFLTLAVLVKWSDAFKQSGVCFFPERWQGTWFQSGVRQSITIDGPQLSSKGRCIGSDGDKYVVVDDKTMCFRCVVIHEKHPNVLQYKETYCHGKDSLPMLCSLITGDALLYSMFREDALPVNCPFHGPFTFTYNRGGGECRNPVSSIDVCTEESRLLLSYQACPDIYGTESTVEELQCLATWKEGSSRYLVGKVHHNHATSNEDRFRCFVYEKTQSQLPEQSPPGSSNSGVAAGLTSNPIDYRVAQSGDATCNGLFSATEGSRTMTLRKATGPTKCRFPNWLALHQHWHSLDNTVEYNFHHRNATLHISNPQGLDMKVICSQSKQANKEDTTVALILAHFTMGCQSGYMCLVFYRRDNHVIEVQTGQHVKRQEDACLPQYFNRSSLPYLTLVTQNVESRQCPYNGKFSVTGLLKSKQQRYVRELLYQQQQQQIIENGNNNPEMKRKKRVMESSNGGNTPSATCDSNNFDALLIGCRNSDTLEFHSDCPVTDFFSAYSCHGRWEENGTNYLIITPQSRSSHGAKRFCFIYREKNVQKNTIHFSISSDNCDRTIRPGIDGELAFNVSTNGQCIEANEGQQLYLTWWTLLTTVAPVLANYILFQMER